MIAPRLATSLAALTLLAAPTLAVAQPAAPAPPAAPRPLVTQTASLNLLALPFGWASGEYERALGGGLALGVGAATTLGYAPGTDDEDSFSSTFDQRLATAQLKLKYYPSENGLRGFAVGVTAGLAHAAESRRDVVCTNLGCSPGPAERRSVTAPTVGAVVDYNFLLGRRRRFLVGIGVGARRVLGNVRDNDPVDVVIPDGRFQVGFGF